MSLKTYLIEAVGEIKKVIWPGKKQIVNYTTLVIVMSIAVAVFFGMLDYVFNLGLGELIK